MGAKIKTPSGFVVLISSFFPHENLISNCNKTFKVCYGVVFICKVNI